MQLAYRYILARDVSSDSATATTLPNPHAIRIASEHDYTRTQQPQPVTPNKKRRILPQWMRASADKVASPHEITNSSVDGVFNYASAVLNDGLLFMELRDAIREGDGPRIIRCWKFMLLYWKHAGHTKYAYEVIELISSIEAASSPRIAHELVWCRVVNTRGGAGNNIPVDLYLEHLNRTLKDYVRSIGANVTANTVVRASKSLRFFAECYYPF